MAARKRRKTAKRRSPKRRKTTARRRPRTAAQKRATAKLVALNKKRHAKKKKHAPRHHSVAAMLPALPKQFMRGASIHTQPTYRPRTIHQPTRVMHRVDHDFYD